MGPSNRNLLTLLDYEGDEILMVLQQAARLKAARLTGDPKPLRDRTGVLIFEKPSLRTRITFETGIHELGGHPVNLESTMVQLGKRESVEDVARNLERWVHLIVARTFSHTTIEQLAAHSSIPVINALTDTFHPCQALAFMQTLHERIGADSKANILFIGDGNNVCISLMSICAKLGYRFTLACPPGYEVPAPVFQRIQHACSNTGAAIAMQPDLNSAIASAEVIYTDVWASMGQEKETEKRKKAFTGYQVNSQLLARASRDVLVSHCLPAHRGEEITSEVLDADFSMALDEAENRLHVQKAIISHLLT
ncbi:MAG: ornithine carbamoyltransferase [Chitinivibrionales bacterium]|nr:ornithine carbamoyltransferase [Chitinivibrionales bacterium]